jgi:hypothetical protein
MRKTLAFGVLLGAMLALNGAKRSLAADNFCGISVQPNKALIKAIIERAPLKAFSGNAKVPPFLEGIEPQIFSGNVNEHQGSVLFTKQGAGWTLVGPKDGEADQGLFASSQSKDVFIVTMIATEGPGPDYTLVRASEGFSKFDCLTIPFPDSIHIPEEYLSLKDFNMDARGKGKLVGSAAIDRGGRPQTWWFQYSTSDFGRTWSTPVRLVGKPRKIPGTYKAVALRPNGQLQRKMEHYFGLP